MRSKGPHIVPCQEGRINPLAGPRGSHSIHPVTGISPLPSFYFLFDGRTDEFLIAEVGLLLFHDLVHFIKQSPWDLQSKLCDIDSCHTVLCVVKSYMLGYVWLSMGIATEPESTKLILTLSRKMRDKLETIAQERGFLSTQEFIRRLIENAIEANAKKMGAPEPVQAGGAQ